MKILIVNATRKKEYKTGIGIKKKPTEKEKGKSIIFHRRCR